MKALIKSDFKALRTGDYVKADEEAGEFIFDSDDCDLSVATLLEIGAKNKIDLKKDKKDNVVAALVTGLEELELPEMSEKPQSEVVAEIVKAGVKAGKEDDEMLIEIVQAGIKFKAAGKLFNQAMMEGGYRITAKERKTKSRDMLVEADFQPSSWDEVKTMSEKIVKEVTDTSNAQALAAIRAYAKEFELELPKPEKQPRGGFKDKVQKALLENPNFSLADFRKLCEEAKRDADQSVKRMWPQVIFAKKLAQAAIDQELTAIQIDKMPAEKTDKKSKSKSKK